MFNNIFFRKSCRLWDDMEKYGTARQVTEDNIIRRMHIAYFYTNLLCACHSEKLFILWGVIRA
jgi:hypothetical protein